MQSKAEVDLNIKYCPGQPELWNGLYSTWKKQQADPENLPVLNCADVMKLWPELCRAEGERGLGAIQKTAAAINDGEFAVAIGHNPLIRLAQAQFLGEVEGSDLEHCQMIRFSFEGNLLCGTQAILLDTGLPSNN